MTLEHQNPQKPNSLADPWPVQHRLLTLNSPWLTLVAEHLLDAEGRSLEYWRVEKADSLVILPIANHHLLLPPPSYRPGVGIATLDFPGGRLPEGQPKEAIAQSILQRELGVNAEAIAQLTPLNTEGWPVNSSFSNQRLYGMVAHLHPSAHHPAAATYPTTDQGIRSLLQHLSCAQCRLVLLEWWMNQPRL